MWNQDQHRHIHEPKPPQKIIDALSCGDRDCGTMPSIGTSVFPTVRPVAPDSAGSAPITVSLIEDHQHFAESLRLVIDNAPGFRCVSVYATAEAAQKRIPVEKPDVVLMDLHLPGLSGIECVRFLKARLPKLKILVLTIEDKEKEIFKTLEAGADGYLEKPVNYPRILEAIRDIHEGGTLMSSQIARMVLRSFHRRGRSAGELENLTAREAEVLAALAQGYLYKEIAVKLHIQVSTVNGHFKAIYKKLHVHSQSEALIKYLQR